MRKTERERETKRERKKERKQGRKEGVREEGREGVVGFDAFHGVNSPAQARCTQPFSRAV